MKLLRTIMVFACTVPFAFGANKDMIELQRDVATLQDQVHQLNDKVVELTTLMRTALCTSTVMGSRATRLKPLFSTSSRYLAGGTFKNW